MKVHDLDEVSLVRRFVRERDEGAFRALYRSHAAAMLAVAWRFVAGGRRQPRARSNWQA